MTHTLHRYGLPGELDTDWTVLQLASPVNTVGSGVKQHRFFELAIRNHAVTIGSSKSSEFLAGGKEAFLETVTPDDDTMVAQVTFSHEQDVAQFLKDLKEADLGISVVIAGLTDHIKGMCESSGAHFHTVTNSLGIWGRGDLIPENEECLAIMTMCGHGMVAETLVMNLAGRVKAGKTTAAKAAREIASCCVCGLVNTERCERLLLAIAETL